ncbi:MAG: hypothetical protein HYY30_00440 [Chloroflexi bacterium]|nr:hypothetical protein [Chloroflexota bacterium]
MIHRKSPRMALCLAFLLSLTMWVTPAKVEADPTIVVQSEETATVLENRRLLTYYGNPYDGRMGIMGALSPEELVAALQQRAAMYEALSDRPVQPAIHFIATVAQASAGADGMYRARMPVSLVQEYADLAAQNGMLLFIDIQVGRSTVQEELAPWIPLLSQPNVHLALDPEFDMWGGQVPGVQLGHMTADEINYAQELLTSIIEQNGLPNKVLIVHQFAASMLPDKGRIGSYPRVEIVTDMDGFGSQPLKLKHYEWYVRDELIEYAGIKLFFDQDTPLFTAEEIMSLDPVPDVIIYQ